MPAIAHLRVCVTGMRILVALLLLSLLPTAISFLSHAVIYSGSCLQLRAFSCPQEPGHSAMLRPSGWRFGSCASSSVRSRDWRTRRGGIGLGGLSTQEDSGIKRFDSPSPPVPIEELPPSVAYIYDEPSNSHIYIVGTFHLSALSAQDVRTTINLTSPRYFTRFRS